MKVSIKTYLITIALMLVVIGSASAMAWRSGWNSHSIYVNDLTVKKKQRADEAIKPGEQKAAQAKSEGKVIYKTITRDVVKYVQDPNRTRCDFDDDAIRLRQRAIDSASNIAGFDDSTMQAK
ncbi:hypothetical protein A8A01_03160 [Ewingella americana]|nr:hypothetical protein A8A01_03160 [Ewingella americana]